MGLQLTRYAQRRPRMNMNLKNFSLVLSGTLAIAICGCNKPSNPETSNNSSLSAEEQEIQKKTREVAVESLGLKLEGAVDAGHRDNFSGLRTENITFTQRLDSRTYIAYDKRFSNTKETGIYKDADAALLKRNHELLDRLKIPSTEIAAERVVQEKTQVGERDSKTGKFKLDAVEPGKKWVLTSRQIEGLPVFSSRAMIALVPSGEVGFLEVHWPEIPPKVTEEARRYRDLVAKGWHAPEEKGTRVESVSVGILHSPTAATALDIIPVIRVIYAPLDKHIGKKPVAYFNSEGKPVAMPRVLLQPPREELKTERAKPQKAG
jgi:hypothetical protein